MSHARVQDQRGETVVSSQVRDQVDESSEAPGVLLAEYRRVRTEFAAFRQTPAGPPMEAQSTGLTITPNFSLSEFVCRDGTPVPDAAIAGVRRLCEKVLQPMRHEFGVCRVTSGYRSPSHNSEVGGAALSYHVYELHLDEEAAAADVYFESGSLSDWAARADQLLNGGGGVGRYPDQGFLHVDNGARAWRQ